MQTAQAEEGGAFQVFVMYGSYYTTSTISAVGFLHVLVIRRTDFMPGFSEVHEVDPLV